VIGRYTLPEMGRVWSEAHKYELWCRVETLVLEAHAEAGVVPEDAVEPVRNASPPTPEAVDEIEQVTQHDVIAFLSAWADNTEPRTAAAYVHFGMTSSDLLDTALAVQLCEATDILLGKLDALVAALRDLGLRHRDTVKVGRTHGIHAEPDTFGHTVANFAFAMSRSRDRLRQARAAVAIAKISGAVGTYSNIDSTVEEYVGAQLGLAPAPAATQVVIRDGISEWVSALAIELRRLGQIVDEFPDGLQVTPRPFQPADIDTYDDHRMAMSFAVAALRVPGIRLRDPGCVAKTFPGFFDVLDAVTP